MTPPKTTQSYNRRTATPSYSDHVVQQLYQMTTTTVNTIRTVTTIETTTIIITTQTGYKPVVGG